METDADSDGFTGVLSIVGGQVLLLAIAHSEALVALEKTTMKPSLWGC